MKRRVIKIADRRYRVELAGGDLSQFSYREKPRRWDPEQYTHVDFRPDEDRWILSWDGIFMDTFFREEDVLLFIIRFGYSIHDAHLVPSEILTDFDLVYEAGDWVDEWGCSDKHEVIFTMRKIQRPRDRHICFEGYPRITPRCRNQWVDGTYYDDRGSAKVYYQTRRRELAAKIVIPKLDFAELEKPRRRRRRIPRNWADNSACAYGGYGAHKRKQAEPRSDEECVFTLKIGKEAEKEHQARKKKVLPLQK